MEETKICRNCHEEKNISEYSKKNKLKDDTQKYQTICKKCVNIDAEIRRNLPGAKEKRDAYDKLYYSTNKEKILEYKKEHHIKNQEEILKKKKIYRDNNKDKIKEYRINNKEKYAEGSKRYRQKYPHIAAWRNILHRSLNYLDKEKEKDTEYMLRYSAATLKHHLEKQFREGMTWKNHGEWQIDHILPLTSFSFDAKVSEVNALSNLQPLWRKDNMAKFNHIIIPS